MQQIAVKSNAKGEYHTQKTKRGSKGQKAVCKIEKGKAQNVSKAKERGKGAKNNIKKVRKRLLKQTDIAKKRRLPQKTANETTENKKTTGKISKGKGRNVSKTKGKRAKGQKQYKKGKKTAVETNRHCEKAKTASKRQRMKQPRIRKQRAKFQRAKRKMSQKQREKGQRGKNNIKKVRKRLLCWQSKSTLVFGKAS